MSQTPVFEEESRKLCEFITSSPSCYHVIDHIKTQLTEQGFQELKEEKAWNLQPGQKYYIIRSGSSLIAFILPEKDPESFQIIASHCDSPAFKIKESPEISKAGYYISLNIEKYGGMLLAPWFDRPLGIAGRVIVRENNALKIRLADLNRDMVLIPSLAIHMNRKANETMPSGIQSEMLPVFGSQDAEGSFIRLIAQAAGTEPESILGEDLFLYNRCAPSVWGADREFLSAPRLDDLQCVYASVTALMKLTKADSSFIPVCCIFDNEEVGSSSMQGADSTFLEDTLKRISTGIGHTQEQYLRAIASGFLLSADNAHAVHPNYPEKADPVNRPCLNGGVVLKFNAALKYTTDGVTSAVFRQICQNCGVPVQTYVNHADIPGGSTLGNISISHVSIPSADIGCPQLAMHSPYETTGIKDTFYMVKAMEAFLKTPIRKTDDGFLIL